MSTGVRVGQGVVAEGAGVWNSHCSHLVMDSADSKLVPIADGVRDEEAVTTKLGSIAMTAPRVLQPQFGDTVVVFGLGLVGQIAARLAVLAGAGRVIAVDPVPERREIVCRSPRSSWRGTGGPCSPHPGQIRGQIGRLRSGHRGQRPPGCLPAGLRDRPGSGQDRGAQQSPQNHFLSACTTTSTARACRSSVPTDRCCRPGRRSGTAGPTGSRGNCLCSCWRTSGSM